MEHEGAKTAKARNAKVTKREVTKREGTKREVTRREGRNLDVSGFVAFVLRDLRGPSRVRGPDAPNVLTIWRFWL